MLKRETCYFCTSTYQLFSILALAIERKETADLYIDPQFKGAAEYAEQIKAFGLFHKVAVIDSERIYEKYYSKSRGFLNHLQIAMSYLHVDAIAGMILGEDVCYDNMFVSSRAYMPRMVMLHYIKHHTETKMFYFDDGVGSYFGNSALIPRRSDQIVRRLLFGRKALDLDHDIYLLAPEIYRKLNPEGTINVFPVQRFWEDPKWLDKLNDLFHVSPDSRIDEKVILLEEPYDIFDEENGNTIGRIYKNIIHSFGNDNSVIKRHPRSEKEEQPGYKYYSGFGIPFEIICMSQQIGEKVLISYASTAAATPKMLLDEEPYVIMLYRIVKSSIGISEVVAPFFECIKETYRDPDRVFIPHSEAELKEILVRIHEETGF